LLRRVDRSIGQYSDNRVQLEVTGRNKVPFVPAEFVGDYPMSYKGKVQNGVILVAGEVRLPEGAEVDIELVEPLEATVGDDGQPTIWQKLADLARWAETQPTDLPSDLAINHDHYLHGMPKRQ
jgi:hypothetical protein